MNKKLFLGMFAATSMLLVTSCSNEELDSVQAGNDAQVSFNLGLEGQIGTKAISDGTKADKLIYSVYKIDAEGNPVLQNVVGSVDGQFVKNDFVSGDKVSITLAKGQTYKVAFWAQDGDCNAYNTSDLTAVTVNYAAENGEGAPNNDELRDAFFKTVEFEVTGDKSVDVVLKRPFAQINVGVTTEDWEAAVASGIKIENSAVVIQNVANEINLLTGAVKGNETVATYASNAIPEETLYVDADPEVEGKEAYKWLSMSYILVADEDTNVDANGMLGSDKAIINDLHYTFIPESGNAITFFEGLNNVPAQRNWRTNIVGQILSGEIEFNITIDPVYDGEYLFPSNLAEELEFAASFGGTVTLNESVEMFEERHYLNVSEDFVLNINEGVTFTTGDATNYGIKVHNGQTVINSNGTIYSEGGGIGVTNGASVIYNGGDLSINTTSTSGRYLFYAEDEGSTITINSGNFDFDRKQNQKRAYIYASAGTTVYVNGGTFGKASSRSGYTAGIMGDGAVIITGGTFGFDPSKWVAEGYTATKIDGVYVVGAAVATVDELKAALNNQSTVNLTSAIDNGSNVINVLNNDVVINMNGYEYIGGGQGTKNYAFNLNGSSAVVNDGNLNGAGFALLNGSSLTINNSTIAAKPGKSGRNMFYVTGGSTVTVNEGTYTFDRTSCYFVYVEEGSTCYINGGHFEKPLANSASKDSFVNSVSTGTVIITGGTFNVDPTKWLAEGYKATKEGKIWTVSAE